MIMPLLTYATILLVMTREAYPIYLRDTSQHIFRLKLQKYKINVSCYNLISLCHFYISGN